MSSTSIFVSGCAGFIGSTLCRTLLEQGYSVCGIDNFDPNYDRQVKEQNLAFLYSFPAFSFLEADLTLPESLEPLISTFLPDVVVHLAAKVGVRSSLEDPDGYFRTNVYGTECLISLMMRWGCKKLIFASSSSVYGDSDMMPYVETHLLSKPLSPYAATKIACEKLLLQQHQDHEFAIVNLRFFTVYGPGQRPDLAIHQFLKAMKKGESIGLYGDGSSTRDYTYISDLIAGIGAAITYQLTHENVCETVNLGSGRPVSLLEMITILGEEAAIKPKIIHLPSQPGDMKNTYASIEKAGQLLGYHPEVSFKEGIKKFVAWYQQGSTPL